MYLFLDTATDTTASSGSIWGMLAIYAVFFLILYFLLIRPQRKQQKEIEQMQSNVKVGDWVLLNNGMYGKVVNMINNCVIVEFGTNKSVMVPVLKSQIAALQEPNLTAAPAADAVAPEAAEAAAEEPAAEESAQDELDEYDKKILEKGEKKGFFKKK